tara:strand:+ start:1359 stop:2417 length:1059 start_codon:yes stop_codon:yes gene_type:complete
MANLPFFPLYASDFLNDEDVALVPNDAVGIYIKLLCRQWIEGSLPSCTGSLSRLSGEDEDSFVYLWELLSHKFPEGEDGRLRNPRLAAERDKAESIHSRKSQGGKTRKAQRKQDSTVESTVDSTVDSIVQSSKTPPCDYDCDGDGSLGGGAGGGGWTRWRHFTPAILRAYHSRHVGPRGKATDAAARMIEKIHSSGDLTNDQAIALAVERTKAFTHATEGAGFIPHLATFCDAGWWEMSEEEWRAHGRDPKEQKKEQAQRRQDRASEALRQERQAEAEADAKARQEASEAKERAAALVAQLEANDPAKLESLVNRAHARWSVLAGRPASSQMVQRAVAQLVKEDGDDPSTGS